MVLPEQDDAQPCRCLIKWSRPGNVIDSLSSDLREPLERRTDAMIAVGECLRQSVDEPVLRAEGAGSCESGERNSEAAVVAYNCRRLV